MMLQVFPLGTNANSDECLTENRRSTHWSSNLDFSTTEFPEVTFSGEKGVLWEIVLIAKAVVIIHPKTQKKLGNISVYFNKAKTFLLESHS